MDISVAAISVLSCNNAEEKAAKALQLAENWKNGVLPFQFTRTPSLRPARPDHPILLPPADMPKRRKGGSIANKIALLHAIAHIELNAIDLAFDIIARFGSSMPKDFTSDWIQVGADEAKHFNLLQERLKSLGSYYGALPAHDGLWESAQHTKDCLAARLAVVPMVLEARGLDVTPDMIKRLAKTGDTESVEILSIIYEEEITHVAAGKRWFSYLCQQKNKNEESHFHDLVTAYFYGQLKPPFNKPARTKAGLTAGFYEPLVEFL